MVYAMLTESDQYKSDQDKDSTDFKDFISGKTFDAYFLSSV